MTLTHIAKEHRENLARRGIFLSLREAKELLAAEVLAAHDDDFGEVEETRKMLQATGNSIFTAGGWEINAKTLGQMMGYM